MDIKKYKHESEFLILIILVFFIWFLGRYLHIDIEALQKSLKGSPLILSSLLYILLYVIVTFFIFFSKDLFWLMGAVLFGAFLSTILICLAEAINAFILFHLARSLGRSYVEKSLKGRYRDLDERLGKISFFWFFIFRATPLIPYRFLDLAVGLTKINFRTYIAAVLLGSPLKILWIQYILYAVGKSIFKDPYALVEYLLRNKTLFALSFIYLLLVVLVAIKIKHKN